ncbi:AP-1 complex subunit sigma-1-like [Spinacia oleracea]|uniref:AP-1 complex subunit sigma-1-like n=1 Tax=Spinacia oleracea TaxID=3562 RepID=A0ABM3R7V2_SPIOL|nr:AP-1 complex subunit sigma-1-like [Spinacia oleracea]
MAVDTISILFRAASFSIKARSNFVFSISPPIAHSENPKSSVSPLDDNELEFLEIVHHFVEILDRYFGSVCELDLIFNFHKAYYILDEILIACELQESSKKTVARLIAAQDSLVEAAKEQESSISNIIAQATK